jgi:hypothetical protein
MLRAATSLIQVFDAQQEPAARHASTRVAQHRTECVTQVQASGGGRRKATNDQSVLHSRSWRR